MYDSSCVLQIGFAAKSSESDGDAVSVDANTLKQGSLYQGVMKSGARKYLMRNADFLLGMLDCMTKLIDMFLCRELFG